MRRTPLATEQPSHSSTQQFNATPRFRPPGTPSVPASTPSTPSASRYLTPRHQLTRQEDIVDHAPGGDPDVHDSIETEDQDIDPGHPSTDTDHDFMIEERNPKRRRFSSSPILGSDDQAPGEHDDLGNDETSSPTAAVASPLAPRHPVSSTAPRFLTSTPSIPQSSQSTFLKPPRFRPPDPPEQAQSDPLPDQFSPHRRGQKYVPGGLAAEVRDWLVNIDSSIPPSGTAKKDGAWRLRLMVDEISGGGRTGFTLVRGQQVLSGDVDTMIDSLGIVSVILAGEGTSTGLQRSSKVEVGKTVGIKSPVWEVVIEGEKWGVGVDWTVLGGLES